MRRTNVRKIQFAVFCFVCLLTSLAFANGAVLPSSLWNAFQANPDAFRVKHAGTKLTLRAVVADTYISIYLTPVVSLVDKAGEDAKVICVLPRLDADKLSDFKKGETVVMTGNFYAAREEKIVIKQCQAVPSLDESKPKAEAAPTPVVPEVK